MVTLYDQTTFSDKEKGTHGDCFRACILTLLQRHNLELPHPIADGGGWSGAFWPAMREIGFCVRTMAAPDGVIPGGAVIDAGWDDFEVPRVVMAAGPSLRGVKHSIVWDREAGRMIHDPHPSRAGLIEIEAFDYLVPYQAKEATC